MPITPFHLGPGAAFKALAPRHFSFAVFAFSQFLIDLEPVSLFLLTGDPSHPWLHTYLGALPVAAASFWPGRLVCEKAMAWWNSRLSESQARWMTLPGRIETRAALAGAIVGAWSHVFIDSFMHADMRPLAPFSDAGRMVMGMDIDLLHWVCVAAGLAGIALLGLYGLRRRRSQVQPIR